MKRRHVINSGVAAAFASVAGCSVLDGNGNGNGNGTENTDTESDVNPQLRDSYDFDVTLEYIGTLVQKNQDGGQQEEQQEDQYTLTVTASGFVDADEENMYYKYESNTEENSQSESGEYYFDSGSEWSRTESSYRTSGEWSSISYGFREEFSNVHLGAYRLYRQNEDATSGFSVNETGMLTLNAEIQEFFFYDPFLGVFASELPPTEVQVEYEFNEESGYLTTSTISLDSVTQDTDDYTLTLEDVVETTNYSELSDYDPPNVPDNSN